MKSSIYILFSIVLFSCNSEFNKTQKDKRKIPNDFDYGYVENGIYKNNYFKLKVNFDPSWTVKSEEEMEEISQIGKDLLSEDNEELERMIDASKVNSANLLTVFKYEIGAPVEFNPSFVIIAENTKNFPGIKKGSDYLFHTKKFMEKSSINFEFESNTYTKKKIGNYVFYIMKTKVNIQNYSSNSEYFTTIINGFSLSFIISFSNDEDKEELYKIINSIKI